MIDLLYMKLNVVDRSGLWVIIFAIKKRAQRGALRQIRVRILSCVAGLGHAAFRLWPDLPIYSAFDELFLF